VAEQGILTTGIASADTGVAADTGWHKLVISSSSPGVVTYAVDAATPVTLSTNAPTVSLNPQVILGTNATAQKTVNLDYFSLLWTGLNR